MYNVNWYYSLNHPPLTPPQWIFPPVWTILYTMIFVSLVVFIVKPYFGNKSWGYTTFFSQLALNLCWSPVFFGFKNVGMALAVLVTMVVFTVFNIVEFFKISKTSGLLLIPYLLWLCFALYLNFGVFVLNK